MAVNREALFEEVWANPMLEVADRYGVSSSYLARVCRNLEVPTPPRGYWARLRGGAQPRRPKLPPARPGADIEWNQSGRAKTEPWPYPKAPDHFRKHHPVVREPAALHPLVMPALEALSASKDSYFNDYLKPRKQAILDVHISRRELDRGLKVFNLVLMSLEACEYSIEIAGPREPIRWIDFKPMDPKKPRTCHVWHWWTPWRPTILRIGTLAIGLSFYEIKEEVLAKEVKNEWIPLADEPATIKRPGASSRVQIQDMPGGRFALRAFSPYEGAPWEHWWSESKPGEWSSTPPSIARTIELASSTIADLVEKAWRKREAECIQREAEHREWVRKQELQRQEEARLEAIRRREKAFNDSRKDLLAMVEDWARAKRIEAFFGDIIQRSSEPGTITQGEHAEKGVPQELLERLSQARDLLGGTDALERFKTWRPPEERLDD